MKLPKLHVIPMLRTLQMTAFFAVFIVSLALGCSPSQVSTIVPTIAVKGKLIRGSTGQPPGEGSVELAAVDSSGKVAFASLASDGTFELSTMLADGTKLTGAEPGEYRATYVPRMSAAQTELPEPIPGTVRIDEQSSEIELRLP